MSKFKFGDLVRLQSGKQGIVVRVEGSLCGVDFNNFSCIQWFKNQDLTLVSRHKVPVKKTIEAWANIYENGYVDLYRSEKEAHTSPLPGHLIVAVTVKLTGEYEVSE